MQNILLVLQNVLLSRSGSHAISGRTRGEMMEGAIELPPGEWKMREYGGTIYLFSADHPPMLIDGGEVKVLEPAEARKVLLVYDAQMRVRSAALDELGKLDGELLD